MLENNIIIFLLVLFVCRSIQYYVISAGGCAVGACMCVVFVNVFIPIHILKDL